MRIILRVHIVLSLLIGGGTPKHRGIAGITDKPQQARQVISIKKFLSSDNETEHALMHVIRLLIQGIGEHAVTGASGDAALFRESIHKISASLMDAAGHDEILMQAGSALNALEDYSHRASRQQALLSTELQHMVKMLTSTVSEISASGDANIARLGEIETGVALASELDDVRVIKTRLSDCLASIRSESDRQRKENRATLEQLRQGLKDQGHHTEEYSPAQDRVTGLPLRPTAEMALASASESGASAYAAILLLDRLQALNLKFGRKVGDEVLGEFARAIQNKLSPGDQLFRWSGPALLALLHRPSIDRVRSEIAQIVETKLEHNIEMPSRSIMIPIGARWAVFPMMAASRLLFRRIDTFAAVLGAREFNPD